MNVKYILYSTKITSYFGIKNPGVFDGFESYNDWQFKPLKKAYSIFI